MDLLLIRNRLGADSEYHRMRRRQRTKLRAVVQFGKKSGRELAASANTGFGAYGLGCGELPVLESAGRRSMRRGFGHGGCADGHEFPVDSARYTHGRQRPR